MTVRELAAALAALQEDQQDVRVVVLIAGLSSVSWEPIERVRIFAMSDGPAVVLDPAR